MAEKESSEATTPEQFIARLLETEVKAVEDNRVYTSSASWGKERYHLIEWDQCDGVRIEQIATRDKWSKRVELPEDEIEQVLKSLLIWYLDRSAKKEAAKREAGALLSDYIEDEQSF